MDNGYVPVARRTRLAEAEMYRKMHEEIKRKRRHASAGSTSRVGGNDGSSEKANGLGYDGDRVESEGGEGSSCKKPIILDDDSDNDLELLYEKDVEDLAGKDFCIVDDDDDGVGLDGGEVGKRHAFSTTGTVKEEDVSVDEDDCGLIYVGQGSGVEECSGGSQCNSEWMRGMVDERKRSGVAERISSMSRSPERNEDVNGDDDDEDIVYYISDDDSEESEGSSSEESEESSVEAVSEDGDEYVVDEDDVDDEDYLVELAGICNVADKSNKNNIDDRSKVDSVNGNRGFNIVAKRTRSHFNAESSEKRMKLGTSSRPRCVDENINNDDDDEEEEEEEIDDNDDDEVDIDDDNDDACKTDLTTQSEKHIIGSEKRSGNQSVQNLSGMKPAKGKRIRAFKDRDVIKILADSLSDKAAVNFEEEEDEPPIEPTLPLKFTYGIEEATPPEKSEEEKELDKLWVELDFCLYGNDVSDNAKVENEADLSPEVELELDIATLCRQGKHEFILDEEIGILCKHCSFVDVEIRYCVPPFSKNPWGKSERRDSVPMPDNVFDKLHSQDSGYDSQPGNHTCGYAQATVWDIIPGIGKSMHGHQREGFEFLWKNIGGGIYLDKLTDTASSNGGCGCIISHAPGTGKTRLAIAFLQSYMELYPTCRPVIVTPCGMLPAWEAEFQKWNVDIPFHNLNRPGFSGKENKVAMSVLRRVISRQRSSNSIRMVKLYSWKKDRSILGVSYRLFEELVSVDRKKTRCSSEDDQVRKVLLDLPGLLILDEGHMPRNDHSLIWKAFSKVLTQNRIILSGTPFQNNFDELFNTLSLANPKFADMISSRQRAAFPKKRGWKRSEARWNWASLTDPIGKVTNDRLKAKGLAEVRDIVGQFVHVHRGHILQERLPGLRDSVIILQPVHFQKTLLDGFQLISNKVNFDLEYGVSVVSVHPSLLPKKSFIAAEFHVDWDKLERLRLNPEAGVKTKFLMELIRLSVARSEKVLVFSQFLGPLDLIIKQLESHFGWKQDEDVLYMHGKLDIDERQSLIKDFNNTKSGSKVLLASTKASSEGINLVGASRVVLLDVVWNPSVERQAISRAYRLGQEKVVYVYHLVTSGTNEEEKYCRQVEKERLSELVFYSSERDGPCENSLNISEDRKDIILEEMIERDRTKDIFKKIIYQPKDSNLVESFGLMGL